MLLFFHALGAEVAFWSRWSPMVVVVTWFSRKLHCPCWRDSGTMVFGSFRVSLLIVRNQQYNHFIRMVSKDVQSMIWTQNGNVSIHILQKSGCVRYPLAPIFTFPSKVFHSARDFRGWLERGEGDGEKVFTNAQLRERREDMGSRGWRFQHWNYVFYPLSWCTQETETKKRLQNIATP